MNDIEHLRHLIEKTLVELRLPDAQWSCVKANSLSQAPDAATPHNGVLAVWLTDRNILEFYGENGNLLKAVSLGQGNVGGVRAA